MRVTKIPGISRANGQECIASLEVKITIESLEYTHIFGNISATLISIPAVVNIEKPHIAQSEASSSIARGVKSRRPYELP